jgi:hypothetical protein
VRVIVLIVASIGLAGSALAQDGAAPPEKPAKAVHSATHGAPRPAPIAIPEQFAPPQEAYASFPEASATAAAPAKPSACQLRLTKLATFQPLPVLVGPGDCGASDAVSMDTITLPDQSKVAVTPPAILRCSMAEQVAQWVRDDIVPSLTKFGSPLRGLDNFASYDCRGRNNVRAAKVSEHGRADALDVRDFKLADDRTLVLTDVNADKDWRNAVRESACARFATVLGPGSDGYHEEHIHLDLEPRTNNYKICEWDVREPPPAQAQAKEPAAPAEIEGVPLQGLDVAPIPIDEVPLPRPRPLAADATTHRSLR